MRNQRSNNPIFRIILVAILLMLMVRVSGQTGPIGIKWKGKVVVERSGIVVEDLKLDTALFYKTLRKDTNSVYWATLRFCYNGFLVEGEVRLFSLEKGFILEVPRISKFKGRYSALGIVDTHSEVRMGIILQVSKCSRRCRKCTYFPNLP